VSVARRQAQLDVARVSRGPVGTAEETILIERLQDCREVKIRCLDTGSGRVHPAPRG
jgi:hypothetical protein